MKKLIYLFCAFTFLFSCSSDDSNENQPILVTQITTNNIVSNLTYNGTKLISIVSESGNTQEFTYTGDLISKIKYYVLGSSNFTESSFEYNSDGKINMGITLFQGNDPYGVKSVYTYNSDGTISYNFYLGNLVSQTELISSSKLFIGTNDEIVKVEEYDNDGDIFERYEYTYDTKNNPIKNITGFNKLPFNRDGKYFNVLNCITMGGFSSENLTNQFQYNSNNYPSSVSTTYGDGSVSNTIFTYNQ